MQERSREAEWGQSPAVADAAQSLGRPEVVQDQWAELWPDRAGVPSPQWASVSRDRKQKGGGVQLKSWISHRSRCHQGSGHCGLKVMGICVGKLPLEAGTECGPGHAPTRAPRWEGEAPGCGLGGLDTLLTLPWVQQRPTSLPLPETPCLT